MIVGEFFDVHTAYFIKNSYRGTGLMEKTLGRKLVLPKRRINSVEEFFNLFPEVKEVMLDGVERPTVRSKKAKQQNKHYSGKKKRHTRKNLVLVNGKKNILLVTPTKTRFFLVCLFFLP